MTPQEQARIFIAAVMAICTVIMVAAEVRDWLAPPPEWTVEDQRRFDMQMQNLERLVTESR